MSKKPNRVNRTTFTSRRVDWGKTKHNLNVWLKNYQEKFREQKALLKEGGMLPLHEKMHLNLHGNAASTARVLMECYIKTIERKDRRYRHSEDIVKMTLTHIHDERGKIPCLRTIQTHMELLYQVGLIEKGRGFLAKSCTNLSRVKDENYYPAIRKYGCPCLLIQFTKGIVVFKDTGGNKVFHNPMDAVDPDFYIIQTNISGSFSESRETVDSYRQLQDKVPKAGRSKGLST